MSLPLNEADGYGDSQIADPLNTRYAEVYRGGNALRFGGALLGGAVNMVTPTGKDAGFENQVRIDGDRVNVRADLVYLALNKPRGVLSAMSDDRGRRTLSDLLTDRPEGERLFHVGRLDADSEGLLLLTNDGEFAHRLAHPSFGVAKTYLATVPGPVGREVPRRLADGVVLEDGPVTVDAFRVVQTSGDRAIVEVVLHEGRKHIVRRMMEAVGHPVTRLIRTAVGPIRLGDMRPGGFRHLSNAEIAALFKAVER